MTSYEDPMKLHRRDGTKTLEWSEVSGYDLAYIVNVSFNRESKVVQTGHRAFITYCDADIDFYQLTGVDRAPQFSTLCCDITIEKISEVDFSATRYLQRLTSACFAQVVCVLDILGKRLCFLLACPELC